MILTRRKRNRQLTVQNLLDTARLIMREEGVAALTMHELARRMHMRAPSLYNYFSGKMEIYDTLYRLGFQMLDEHLQAWTKDASDPYDEFRLYIEGYMSFARAYPEFYQLCFERPVPGFVPSPGSLGVSMRLLQRSYARAEQLRKKLKTDLSAQQLADMLIALMHGLTAMHLANEPELPVGQGRFGSLVPAAVSMLKQAWPPKAGD